MYPRLKSFRESLGMTQEEFGKSLNIAKSTYNNYETGIRDPKSDFWIAVAKKYGVTIDYLMGYSDDPYQTSESIKKSPSISDEAQKIAARYSKLDRYGKAAVQALMGEEEARIKDQAELDLILTKPEPKIIPLYWTPAAAGIASPALGTDYDNYTLTPEDPQGAVFAVKIQGDSMEPHFPDGSIVFCNHDPIADGDVGVFCLDGDIFIKQYHYEKFMGMTYLFSLNRDRADADKLITRTGGQTLTCFGRVMTRRRYPVPM